MKNKFKIGDRVRIVRTSAEDKEYGIRWIGATGTVITVDEDRMPYCADVEGLGRLWLYADQIEAETTPKTPKPAPVNFLLAQGNSITEFDTLARLKAHIGAIVNGVTSNRDVSSLAVYEVKAKRKVIIGTRVTIK